VSPEPRRLRIGTRASALARWQAEHVAAALSSIPGGPEPELVLIRTEGDRIQDVPLSQVKGKAFFTKEIEQALLENQADIAVHSLKDLATEMPPGLALGAVLEREDPRDALLTTGGSVDLGHLPKRARIGTSSLRRRALLARWRPDLDLAELRGNVPTRIGKLDAGDYDGIVLAAAGVKRLGLEERISSFLPLDHFLPAVSQGAIGVQIRSGDETVARWVEVLDHAETRAATAAERAFLRRVEGGCQIPVGAFAEASGKGLKLRAVICSLDGTESTEGEATASVEEAEDLGRGLAENLLDRGGRAILDRIRQRARDR
jgi:hydroxymethylbilane synthase